MAKSLSRTWQTLTKFLTPGITLTKTWLLQAFAVCGSLLSVCLSLLFLPLSLPLNQAIIHI